MIRHDQAIEPLVYNCYKKSIFHHKLLFNREMDHLSSAETALNTFQNVAHVDIHWVHVEAIYRVCSPCQFSWEDLILLKYWHPLTETFHWYLDIRFVWQVFIIKCRWTFSPLQIFEIHIHNTKLLKPVPYCPITTGSFTPCSFDIGSFMRGINDQTWTHAKKVNASKIEIRKKW